MAQGKNTTDFGGLLFQFMGAQDPMLSMLEWLCSQMMEAEVSSKLGAEKHEQSEERTSHRCGFRPRRLDTRLGTMYLLVPKVRNGGYIPFFVTERRRSEAALVQVVQEAFVQGVSTRKMEKLAKSLGIEGMSHDLTCKSCGIRFEPLRGDAKYCSGACRQRAYRAGVTDKHSNNNDAMINRNKEGAKT